MGSFSMSIAAVTTSTRGIPPQEFIENVPEYCKAFGDAKAVITAQQEMYSKYKFMEQQMTQHRNAVSQKRTEIEKSVAMLKSLIANREKSEESLQTHFQLGNCLYANANITTNETIESLDTDLDFIKDQITTTEVNIARVFNNDVREKRKASA